MIKTRRLTPDNSAWVMAGNAGDTGGASALKPVGTIQMLSTGDALVCNYQPGGPFNNAYIYQKLLDGPAVQGLTNFTQTITWRIPGAVNLSRVRALEFEMQLLLNGGVYNMAHQWLLMPGTETTPPAPPNTWRVFDYPSKTWKEALSMPISLAPNVLHTFVADHTLDLAAQTIHHNSVTIDGVPYPISFSQPVTPNVYPGVSGLNIAFQLDSNALGQQVYAIVQTGADVG